MKKNLKKILSIVMILTMVFAMTATAFANTNTDGYVTVSVLQNSFNLSGGYVSNGPAVTLGTDENGNAVTIVNYQVPISKVEEFIADSEDDLKSVYLPSGVTDPMDGTASVADAIIAAVWEKCGKYSDDAETVPTVTGGWDSWTSPNGGYISNIVNYPLQYNDVTYFEGENGNKWGRSTGTGWNIAYKYANGTMVAATQYTTNIALVGGMEIIFDVSSYDMTWDTGAVWTE